ncbi:unnamed protein product [Closterium sp. NIES-65]|nr:unnamed protein product [Closterium sp. NIES-65]
MGDPEDCGPIISVVCAELCVTYPNLFEQTSRRVPVAFAPPVAFTSPPSPSLLPRRLHSPPSSVAFISPSRRLHFPLPSPSLPPPVAFNSPSRRLHFPLPSPSLPPLVTFTSPSRRLHFPLPSHSLPHPSPSLPLPLPFTLSCSISFPLLTPHAMGRDERVGGMGREAMVNRGERDGQGSDDDVERGGEKGGRREG